MSFSEKLNEKKFIVTAEVGPPKGVNIGSVLDEAENLKGKVDAFNVTDLQSSVMRLGSLAVSHLLQERGMEAIFQMTCRDRNRLSLQSDLLNAYVLGIRNVLALTGDHPSLGDHPNAKPVFDLDSVSLLQVASNLMDGRDMNGNELDGKPEFCLGAVVNPGADPYELQILKMQKKIECGAKFIQTQAVFDLEKFAEFMNQAQRFGVPILGGIIILKSAGMAKFMNKNIAGISVPEKYIEKMINTAKEDRPKVAVEIANELIEGMKTLCQGVHIMALGWERYVLDLLKASALI
jgi:methylenetetrahydrofolate reductase (NADPH)